MASPRSDRWFLALWLVVALAAALSRKVFIGDGVKHVTAIMAQHAPVVGEARWLLFPTFLYGLLEPLRGLGLIRDTESAMLPYVLASVAASAVVLLALRTWLEADGVPPGRRWVALGVASLSHPFLFHATDTAEPIFAVALSVAGLAVMARTGRTLLGLTMMALALLLHQVVVVAFFFLPMALGWERLRQPRILRHAVAVGAGVTVITLGAVMVIDGLSVAGAVKRVVSVYRNPVAQDWMRGGLLKGTVVTLVGGFPQGLVNLPGMQGLKDIVVGLRQGEWSAVDLALRLLVGQVLYVVGTVYAVRRRRWDWLVALGGCALLPVVWNNMYGYAKFYLLFAILAAHVVARLTARVGLVVVVVLGLLNVSALATDVHAGRVAYALRATQYRTATSGTAWIASGWDPDLVYRWPGSTCAMLRSFMAPARKGATADEIRRDTSVEFMACVERAFCAASAVWTGDWILAGAGQIERTATFFGLPLGFVGRSLWRGPQDGMVLGQDTRYPVYTFSAERQAQVCGDLRRYRERVAAGGTSPGSGRREEPGGPPPAAAHDAGADTGAGLGGVGQSATRPTAMLYRPTPGHR